MARRMSVGPQEKDRVLGEGSEDIKRRCKGKMK